MKTIVVFFLFAAAPICVAGDRPRLAQEDDIREAVFRYQFGHNGSDQRKSAVVYCLSVGDQDADPADEFITRFATHKPPVRKASECDIDPHRGVVDKRTGRSGLAFRVTNITWISDTEVKVTGGWYDGRGLSSSGNTYMLAKRHGKWKIKDRMSWISV